MVTPAIRTDNDSDPRSHHQAIQVTGAGNRAAAGKRPRTRVILETEEGILYADLDPDLIAIAKSAADPVGHYSRPDVLRLLVNRNPAPRVVEAPPEEQPAAAEPTMASA
jgi:hypothetical protein